MPQQQSDASWMGPLPAVRGCRCHICIPERSYDKAERATIDAVLTHGWQVVLVNTDAGCSHPGHVHPAAHDPAAGPAFAYTVGLGHRFGHPELMMSGLDHRLMHGALNDLARRVMIGRRLTPGEAVEGVLANVPLAIERVSGKGLRETVIRSGWFHRRKPAALAVVWPDRRGVFAWQPGAPDDLTERQPPRWRLPIAHTGGLANDPPWDFPAPPDHLALSCTHVVDGGEPVLWAARQSRGTGGEDWSIHCGAAGHATDDIRPAHLAHLVRSAPSLRQIGDLGLDEEAYRPDPDSAWATTPITD